MTSSRLPHCRLSAVIVTHESADAIESCITSVRWHLPDSEIIVIDNASRDETVTRGQKAGASVTLHNSGNVGFGRACNQGAEAAQSSHILFLNPDVRLISVDAAKLTQDLAHERFGLLGPLFRARARTAPLVFPDRVWPIEVFEHSLGPLRPRELPALPKVPWRRGAWWPSGATLLCSRAEFLRLGGFRREFFLYYEDRDLARRYREVRLPVGTTRSIVAAHTAGTSSGSEDEFRTAAHGWAYLGWIEYLSAWHGQDTARRAVAYADRLCNGADRVLALLSARGPLARRANRKRTELQGIQEFVRWQSTGDGGTADAGFCPHAREIISQSNGSA